MNTELAYEFIAKEAISFCDTDDWESIVLTATVYEKMVSSKAVRVFGGKVYPCLSVPSLRVSADSSEAVIFIRDNLMEVTGDRIWGIKFSLQKNGKFNIEYSYDKPEGYGE